MTKGNLFRLAANGCACFMFCVLPLLVHDAYFDINRFKVGAMCIALPLFALLGLMTSKRSLRSSARRLPTQDALLVAFMAACVIACARTGFDVAAITGSEGRYAGLAFLLCCGMAYMLMGHGQVSTDFCAKSAVLCASCAAFLGILNTLGLDPLRFYDRIADGQAHFFVSTIGNVDFFGAYLAMILPLALGWALFGREGMKLAWASSALLGAGILLSRTDTAFASLQIACIVLFVLSADDWKQLCRLLCFWGASFLALPVFRLILTLSCYELDYSGVLLMLCETGLAYAAGVMLLSAAAACRSMLRRQVAPPGSRRAALYTGALAAAAGVCLIALLYTVNDVLPQDNVPALLSGLRIDDAWGSRRGFVYRRALRALSDYEWGDLLFGKGVDLTRRILTPYFDDPSMMKTGVFNDAHCQILQYLLTTGLLGALSFAGFYLSMLIVAAQRAGKDPVLCGTLAALCGYSAIMMFCVAQPILLAIYFSLCALVCARIRAQSCEGGAS